MLMLIGSLFSLAHGSALPAMIIVFGDMTDLFVDTGKFQVLLDGLKPYLSEAGLTYDQVYDNPLLLK